MINENWLRRMICERVLREIFGANMQSLEAALWAFYKTDSFEEGCLMAVNLGEDADTTSAIYGQLAGVYYGFSNIPVKWRKKLAKIEMIEFIIEKLLKSFNQVRSL
jgi:ADP-ribosyl-[dinitrogen reductase] hydrolase